jgi:hypothetical protein
MVLGTVCRLQVIRVAIVSMVAIVIRITIETIQTETLNCQPTTIKEIANNLIYKNKL